MSSSHIIQCYLISLICIMFHDLLQYLIVFYVWSLCYFEYNIRSRNPCLSVNWRLAETPDIWIFSLISYRIHLLCLLSSFYDHSHTCVNPLHQFTPNRVHGDVIRIPANEMNISSHDYRSGVHYIGEYRNIEKKVQ